MTTMDLPVSKNEAHDPGGDLEPRKWCSNGKHYAPLSDFVRNKKSPDGLHYECKPCANVRQAAARRDELGMTKRQRAAHERRQEVRRLHEQGYNIAEIARKMGIDRGTAGNDLKGMGLALYANGGDRSRPVPLSVVKTLDRIAIALAGLTSPLDQLRLDDVDIDDDDRHRWLKELDKAATSINRARRQLRQKGASE